MNFFSKYFCLGIIVFCFFSQANGMEQKPKLSGFLIGAAKLGIKKKPEYLIFISRIKIQAEKFVSKDEEANFEVLCGDLNYFLGWARKFWVNPFVSPLVVESLGGEGTFIELVNSEPKQTAQQFLAENREEKCMELAQFFGDLEHSVSPNKLVLK